MAIADRSGPAVFSATRLWEFNVWMATVGGLGGGLVLCAVFGIILWDDPSLKNAVFTGLVALSIIGTLALAFLGNMIAIWPYRVEFETRKGIRLFAPFKSVDIPLDDIRHVRRAAWMQSFQQGIVVSLSRRRGLLKFFVIHWGFGKEGRDLANLLEDYLANRP